MSIMLRLCVVFLAFFAAWPAKAQTTEDELFSTAQRAFDDGFHDVAIRYLEQFLPQFPESPKLEQAKLLLGECYYFKNQFKKAMDTFKSIKSQKNQDEVLFWMGETYLKLSDHVQARQNYQTLLTEFPNSTYLPQALYSSGWSYFDKKQYVPAKRFFLKLVAQFPKHQLSEDASLKIAQSTYNLGEYATAIEQFETYLGRYPQSAHATDIHLSIADAYYYMDNFTLSQAAYDKVIKSTQEPRLVLTAYIGKVWCGIKKKNYDPAQKLIKEAVDFAKSKDLSQEDLVLAQAHLFYERGDWQGSVNAYKELIRKFPGSRHRLEAYLGRGNANYSLRKFQDAADDFKFILSHHQPSGDEEIVEKANLGLGWAYVKLNDMPAALKCFKEVSANAKRPETKVNALVQVADAQLDNGRFNEAITMYGQILKDNPGNALGDYIQYRLGIAFLKSDQTKSALDVFQNLQRMFPNSRYLEDIDYYLGVMKYKEGNWSAAAERMQEFLKGLNHPSDFAPQANYILALSHLNQKQPDEALKIFQKILRLYPTDETVAKNSDIGIAKCQFELGQAKEAVKRFKLIVYKYPKTTVEKEALLWLAQYEMKNSQYEEAVVYYTRLLDHFPDNPQNDQIHYELGQAYEILGAVDQSLAQYKAVSDKDPALSSKVKLAIAGIFSKEFDSQKALNAYENIVATTPEYARDAYLKMAQLHRNNQNYEEEIETYKKATKAETGKAGITNAELMFGIGDTYEVMGRIEEAVDYYLKIPDQYPDQTIWIIKAYLRVAKIFEDRQDWEGARVTYQKIIQLKAEESKYAQERLDLLNKEVLKRGRKL